MAHVDEYLVEEKQYEKDYCKIIFRAAILFNHEEVVRTVLDPSFGKSASGEASLKSFIVTTGGYDTIDGGFQYTVSHALSLRGDVKRIEHSGDMYSSLKLGFDEFISRLDFVLTVPRRKYSMTFYANCLEIKPKPPEEIVEMCIIKLKNALATSHEVFLQSAKTKFQSGIIDFLGQRYRAVPHNIYYSLFDLLKCFSIWSGMTPSNDDHDRKAQKRLTAILNQISSGEHRQFANSSIWKEHADVLRSIDVERYASLVTDLYKMRKKADYDMDFEIGEFLPELSNLMLKVEELFTLAMYMEDGSIALTGQQLVLIFHSARELEPLGEATVEDNLGLYMVKRGKVHCYNILQEGLVLAEGYDLRKFLIELIKRKEIYFSPFRPPFSRRSQFVKIQKKGDSWTFSNTLSEEIAKEQSYIPYTIENVRKISEETKPDELLSIQKSATAKSRSESFCYGRCFFELVIFSDGRFYLLSPLIENDVNKQVEWSLRLRAVIAKVVDSLWEHQSTISFSALSLAPLF